MTFEIICGNCRGIVIAPSVSGALRRLIERKGKKAKLAPLMRWRKTTKQRGGKPIRDTTVPWFYQTPQARLMK